MIASNVLYDNENYEVRVVDNALDENGRDRAPGYGIFNKVTGIREATSLVLPNAMWKADMFLNMTKELETKDEALEPLEDVTVPTEH